MDVVAAAPAWWCVVVRRFGGGRGGELRCGLVSGSNSFPGRARAGTAL